MREQCVHVVGVVGPRIVCNVLFLLQRLQMVGETIGVLRYSALRGATQRFPGLQ